MNIITILLSGFAGFAIFKLANFHASGKTNKETPKEFNLKYWISDQNNWNDMLLGFIVFCVIARYKEPLFTAFADNFLVAFLAPYKDDEFLFIGIGFSMSFIIMLLRALINKITTLIKILKKDK